MTRLNLATSNGFLFVDGKLRAYEFKSAIVNFSSGEVTYTCILGGEEKTFTTEDCPKVYKDEDAFKAGEFINGHHYTWAEAIRSAFFYVRDSINDSCDCTMYAVKDNEVIAVPAPKDGFDYYNGRTKHPASGTLYETREHALLHCDLVVVDEKGQETTTLSPAKRVTLNEEQKEALEALEMAFKRLNEVGVTLCTDTESEDLYVFSNKDIKEQTWDCCGEVINKYGYGINDLMTKVRNGSPLSWCFSDTTMYVKFKD